MAPACTVTAVQGRKVRATTLEHLLREDALARVEGREWYFCPDPGCDIVYFTADGGTLAKSALSVRVGIKESKFPRPICYCFGHDVADVEREAALSGESAIAADITAKCRQGLDRCEQTNPQGSCCLGNVRRVFEEARRVRRDTAAGVEASRDCCASEPRKEHP